MLLVREKPPLRLHASISVPNGPTFRWGSDEHSATNAPVDLTFSNTMPGGFEQCSLTLARKSEIDYSDLAEFSTATLIGAGGQIAWQGRLERAPRSSGDHLSVSPGLVGWQNHLSDNKTARMIYVDVDMTHWQGPGTTRQLALNSGSIDFEAPTVSWDTSSPAVVTSITGPWSRSHSCEAWYDAQALAIGQVYYAWKAGPNISTGDTNWSWVFYASTDDAFTHYDQTGNLRAVGPGSGTLVSGIPVDGFRHYAIAAMNYSAAVAGNDGKNYPILWTCLAVYGPHGLTTRGTGTYTSAPGLYASDVIAHALSTWAPLLALSKAGASTIQASTFVIPQLAFFEPTTAAEIVKQATRFDLQDWAVWEGPTFYWAPQGTYGRNWRARVGPAQLQENGPQVDRIWNGVIVQYTDVSGVTRTVGPTGSGANAEGIALLDTDPANPANSISGLKRWTMLQMGTSTVEAATRIGQTFLQEQKLLDTSGEATLVGHVEDDHGVIWPAWMVRAGDTITFTDAADPSPRRIVRAEYTEASKSCHVSLDSPPEGLQALLERLSVAIQPLGFS